MFMFVAGADDVDACAAAGALVEAEECGFDEMVLVMLLMLEAGSTSFEDEIEAIAGV